ncbi:MAG: MFS transporter [Anaerolineae bacterium]|nr:MFS transporter [Anaerolineae bacterium]
MPSLSPDPVTPGPESPRELSLRAQLAIIFVARTILNTSHRIVYPFLPAIARGLGLSVAAAGSLVTARFVAGLAAPFLGPWTDRQPRRRIMQVSLGIFALAAALMAVSRGLGLAVLAFALFGLSKVLYDPAVHAYMGDTVPYDRRAWAVGTVELAWSGGWLLGVPATGFLIERFGWRSPWVAMAVLGVLSMGLTRISLPLGRPADRAPGSRSALRSLLPTWRSLLRRRPVIVLLATTVLILASIEIPFIVYGAWLESSFGLSLSTLGLASIAIGAVEAVAEFGTTVITDRLGKRRSVLMGLLCLAGCLLLLPMLANMGLVLAMSGLVAAVLCFEFSIVSLLPLATELVPEARASLLSLNMMAMSAGRMIGATSGGWLWEWQPEGIGVQAAAGAGCALVAALLLWRGMTEIPAAAPAAPVPGSRQAEDS